MKRGSTIVILILLLATIILGGCKSPYALPEVKISEEEVIDVPSEIEEVPAEEVPEEEPVEEVPAEEISEEEPAEEVPAETQEGPVTIELKKNEVYDYNGKLVKFEEYYNGDWVEVSVDGILKRFSESRSSEIIEDLKITYERSFYTERGTIQLTIEDFTLGENEYIIKQDIPITVNGEKIKLSKIKVDTKTWDGIASIYRVNADGYLKLKRGESGKLGNVTITLIEPFWRTGEYYAHMKIV